MSDMKKSVIGIILLLLPVSFVACGIKNRPETTEPLNWAGEYLDENGNVNLKIEENKLVFTATDASGEPIRGEIEKTDNGADVIFIDSTWEYIENGDRYSYWSK